MSNKHITIKELNNEGVYDTLYPNTSATQVPLSAATSQLFGQTGLNTDAALYKIIEKLRTDKKITVRVTDSNGNPVQGAKINGLLNSPTTGANGTVTGVFVSDPLTIVSPYVDIQDGTANGADYVGTINVLEVVLQAVAENTVIRYTSSTSVKFSTVVDTIDICCVGGGGGGANYAQHYDGMNWTTVYQGSGGGGGGIVNAFGMAITADENYQLYVGSGGATREVGQSDSSGYDGGSSSFLGISANGGGGGVAKWVFDGERYSLSVSAGKAGYTGCGDGGYADGSGQTSNVGSSNTTVSEFNDNATFYSGGGGSGSGARKAGGTPNGAAGAYQNINTAINAGKAGVGGGGGGGMISRLMSGSDITGNASAGGPGLVAIRIHLK